MVSVQPCRQIVERMFACVTSGLSTLGVRTGSARIAVDRWPCPWANRTTTAATRARAMRRSAGVIGRDIRATVGRAPGSRKTLLEPCPGEAVGSGHGRDRRPPERPVLAPALDAARRRRDPAGARGPLHGTLLRSRRPGLAVAGRHGDDPIRVRGGGREAPVGARAGRRPLRVPPAGRRRPSALPRGEAPARATPRAYRDGRSVAPPRGLRAAHRLEDGTESRTARDPRTRASGRERLL